MTRVSSTVAIVAVMCCQGCKNGATESSAKTASSPPDPSREPVARSLSALTEEGFAPIEDVVQLGADDGYSCALDGGGKVWCWGHVEGRGLLHREWKYPAATAVPDATEITQLAFDHGGVVYGLRKSGDVVAWGHSVPLNRPEPNSRDVYRERSRELDRLDEHLRRHPAEIEVVRIGDGSLTAAGVRAIPTWLAVHGRVFASDNCVCLYDHESRLTCKHTNVGNDFFPNWTDGQVRKIRGLVEVQAADGDPGCWLFEDGRVECWSIDVESPFAKRELGIVALPAKAVGLKYSSAAWTAVLGDGTVAVWFGDFRPYIVKGIDDAIQVDHHYPRACAVTTDHEVWCWRLRPWKPDSGVDMAADAELTRIEGLEEPVQVAVSVFHACALQKDGRVRCWGKNSEGQCGIGRFTETVDEPALVVTKAE